MRVGGGLVALTAVAVCASLGAYAAGEGPVLKFVIYERAKPPRTQVVAPTIIKIGTLPSCDVQLSDKRVDKVHAIIEVRGPAEIRVIDLGARSGTFVNGKRVTSTQGQGERLRNGDEIKLGDTRLVVEIQPEPR